MGNDAGDDCGKCRVCGISMGSMVWCDALVVVLQEKKVWAMRDFSFQLLIDQYIAQGILISETVSDGKRIEIALDTIR